MIIVNIDLKKKLFIHHYLFHQIENFKSTFVLHEGIKSSQ